MVEKHGMSSEKASRVKQRGHNKEYLFANLIRGEAVKGTNKIDVFGKDGRGYTVKGGSEVKGKSGREGRRQLFMFGKRKFIDEINFPGRKFFIDILESFPVTKEKYDKNPKIYKKRVKNPMIQLKKFLINRKEMHRFFDKAIFNCNLDYLVIYHDDIFHIFSKEEVLRTLGEKLEIINNSTFQKVVFRYNCKIIIEIEVRKSEGKYPSILLIATKMKIFNLLMDNIKDYIQKTKNLYVYGAAKDTFSC